MNEIKIRMKRSQHRVGHKLDPSMDCNGLHWIALDWTGGMTATPFKISNPCSTGDSVSFKF